MQIISISRRKCNYREYLKNRIFEFPETSSNLKARWPGTYKNRVWPTFCPTSPPRSPGWRFTGGCKSAERCDFSRFSFSKFQEIPQHSISWYLAWKRFERKQRLVEENWGTVWIFKNLPDFFFFFKIFNRLHNTASLEKQRFVAETCGKVWFLAGPRFRVEGFLKKSV